MLKGNPDMSAIRVRPIETMAPPERNGGSLSFEQLRRVGADLGEMQNMIDNLIETRDSQYLMMARQAIEQVAVHLAVQIAH